MFSKLRNNPAPETSNPAVVPEFGSRAAPERPPRSSMAVTVLESHKPAVISADFTVKGDIESSGTLHVEGTIEGTIRSEHINISATGRVEGELRCSTLNIKGYFAGTAVCEELVVASSAHVKGHLTYKFLTVGTGARLEGDMVVSA